jgi:DNA-binding transcriptional LysR family regulator
VPAAQQLVDSADALQQQTGRRRSKAVGRVRLSVPVPLGLYFSAKLGALLDQHEDLSIDLILHDRLRDLIEEGIDLQVCVGQVSDSALISRRIGATTAFLVAAPSYSTAAQNPSCPPTCNDTSASSITGERMMSGGSLGRRGSYRYRCAADFEPIIITPTRFGVLH